MPYFYWKRVQWSRDGKNSVVAFNFALLRKNLGFLYTFAEKKKREREREIVVFDNNEKFVSMGLMGFQQ